MSRDARDTVHTKYISQLVNAHKVAGLLVPLIEAVDINKRTRAVDGLSLPGLLKHVIEVGGELYQGVLGDNEQLVDTGLVPDKLFLTLSKALRNSIVLYNSPSLSLFKDDVADLFDQNIGFIQRYQSTAEKTVSGAQQPQSAQAVDDRRARQESMGYAAGALSQMFMPLWVFHTSLYTSGYIDEEQLAELNRAASDYLVAVMTKLMDRMGSPQGEFSEMFRVNSLFITAEMIANIVYDYHRKLIKNKAELDEYLLDPGKVLSKLLPALYANFASLNAAAEGALYHMFNPS